jgi:hypothetical protein
MPLIASGGETSPPSQVYLVGMRASVRKAGEVSSIPLPPGGVVVVVVAVVPAHPPVAMTRRASQVRVRVTTPSG